MVVGCEVSQPVIAKAVKAVKVVPAPHETGTVGIDHHSYRVGLISQLSSVCSPLMNLGLKRTAVFFRPELQTVP